MIAHTRPIFVTLSMQTARVRTSFVGASRRGETLVAQTHILVGVLEGGVQGAAETGEEDVVESTVFLLKLRHTVCHLVRHTLTQRPSQGEGYLLVSCRTHCLSRLAHHLVDINPKRRQSVSHRPSQHVFLVVFVEWDALPMP